MPFPDEKQTFRDGCVRHERGQDNGAPMHLNVKIQLKRTQTVGKHTDAILQHNPTLSKLNIEQSVGDGEENVAQALKANKVYQLLSEDQRKIALVEKTPPEAAVVLPIKAGSPQ